MAAEGDRLTLLSQGLGAAAARHLPAQRQPGPSLILLQGVCSLWEGWRAARLALTAAAAQ